MMGIFDRLKGVAKDKLNGFLDEPTEPEPEEEAADPPTISLRFRVTTADTPATADMPAVKGSTYYVYGRDATQALARLPASMKVTNVEQAGWVENGVLILPEDELKVVMVDGREVPGTPGPVK